ncbi:hypothetical protein ACH4MA_04115 [Streptomyces roseolus]|uniref:hypothetical protein n=1 Tax=Streptomyces roseolus TaxID=67358 RepID=UPI0037919DB3
MQTGDAVLRAPAAQGLVALQPHQGLGPVRASAQDRLDGRGVARRGEEEQCGFGGGPRGLAGLVYVAGIVGLVLVVLDAGAGCGGDDAAVLVALDVELAVFLAAVEERWAASGPVRCAPGH